MQIRCTRCGHREETNLGFFVNLIGGIMPIGGYWAWVAYLFAGTGFAMPIVIAIIAGGTAMLVFRDEIVTWVMNVGYECPRCGHSSWE